jgi:hypothetical protein
VTGEANGSLPHASGGGMDEHDLTLLDLAQRLQRCQGCGPVQHHAEGGGIAPAGRHRKHTRSRHRHVLREGPRASSDDVSAERQRTLDIRADTHDLTGGFEARDIRNLRTSPVCPTGLHDISEVDPGSAHADQVLAGPRAGATLIGGEGQFLRSPVRPLDQYSHRLLSVLLLVDLHAANVEV